MTVPNSDTPGGFKSASGPGWGLVDLDGDGRSDLVQTTDPRTGSSPFVNTTNNRPYWKVWLNLSGATTPAFSNSPIEWRLASATFSTLAGAGMRTSWRVFDLNGDSLPELVQPTDPATGLVWSSPSGPGWRSYASSGRDFNGSPLIWLLPATLTANNGLSTLSGPEWTLLDVDGDGALDLVVFRDAATGQAFTDSAGAFWQVYLAVP